VLRHVAGWGLLLLGVAGLFLPVIQGWLLIGLGALLLSPDVPLFARLVDWIERKFPFLRAPIHRVRRRLHRHRPEKGGS
jgi:hypothetical protein